MGFRANPTIRAFLVLAVLLVPAAGWPEEGTPFLYHGLAGHRAGSLSAEWQSAVGTREARPFASRGFETGLQLDFVPVPAAGLRFSCSYLFSEDTAPRAAVFLEGSWRLSDGERQGVDLGLAFGFGRDFRDTWFPRVRLYLGAQTGRLQFRAGVVAEFPLAEGRDDVDVVMSAAAAYRLSESWALGVEAAGEDLEGFFEEHEAEGGARLLLGPTLWVGITRSWYLKINAALCVTGRVEAGVREIVDPGLAARLALGYAF